jgi:hypothetical protein
MKAADLDRLVDESTEVRELLERMMTIIEGHVDRIERLEYHVFKQQPLPKMRTARCDH